MNAAIATEGRTTGDLLLEAVSPQLYQDNSFRILELPVGANNKEVRRQSKTLGVRLRVGGEEMCREGGLYADVESALDAVRQAEQRIADPFVRLVDTLFWFWSPSLVGQAGSDLLGRVSTGDSDIAAASWREAAAGSESPEIMMHDLAILSHAAALEIELKGLQAPLKSDLQERAERFWKDAYFRWKSCIDQDEIWTQLDLHIKSLADPRLRDISASGFRYAAPAALLSINAALAATYIEKGEPEQARRHRKLLDRSGFPSGKIEEVCAEAVSHHLERIRQACETADQLVDQSPNEGAVAARGLLAQTESALQLISILLGDASVGCEAAHDQVAQSALRCQIAYGNKTEDWKSSVELLQSILGVARGESARNRIESNLKIVRKNLEGSLCWFCGQEPGEEGRSIDFQMYGDVTRTPTWEGTRVTWRTATVKVPRCASCHDAHSGKSGATISDTPLNSMHLGIGASILGIVMLAAGAGMLGIIVTVFGVITLVGSFLRQPQAKSEPTNPASPELSPGSSTGQQALPPPEKPKIPIKPAGTATQYPAIQELRRDGWSFGERP